MNSIAIKRLSKITFQLFLFGASTFLVSSPFKNLSELGSQFPFGELRELGLEWVSYVTPVWMLIFSIPLYFVISATIQGTKKAFSERTVFAGSILAVLYILSVIFWILVFLILFRSFNVLLGRIYTLNHGPIPEHFSPIDISSIILMVTALTGLISAVSGVLAQFTARRKTLADIEIEKQKLDLEREKLQLEKGKAETRQKTRKSKRTLDS